MLDNVKKIYMIGIGGISMSALAKLLLNEGFDVCGNDVSPNEQTEILKKLGVKIVKNENLQFVRECDAVVYTSAVSEDSKALAVARKLKKKIFSRAEILGYFSRKRKCISVAGTHGKTTTTGMIASLLLCAGKSPTIHIGGNLKNIGQNLFIGSGEYFLTEACEYKDSFLNLSNYISIVLNIEPEHLDYFKNFDNEINSFNKFIKNTNEDGYILINSTIKNILQNENVSTLTFGFDEDADIKADNIFEYKNGRYKFDVIFKNEHFCTINLPCFCKHNILNSMAAVGVGIVLGMDAETIKKGIENFQGVERRMEIVYENQSKLVFHDYAHHPTEIKSTLSCFALKQQKLIAIFQPHTFSRMRDLYNDFLSCFKGCDEVWLLPIYPAREKPIDGINSFNFAKDLNRSGIKARYFGNFKSCKEELGKSTDGIFAVLGAGDIVKMLDNVRK